VLISTLLKKVYCFVILQPIKTSNSTTVMATTTSNANATTPTTTVNNNTINNNHVPPPATSLVKNVNPMGPFIQKPRRQNSSRFSVNKQNIEIESLPPIKGELLKSIFSICYFD
jgi:hypothetical protein